MGYSSFSTIPQKDEDGSLQFLAVAHCKGDKGEKAEVTTLYHLNPESGKIDITSTVKNTGGVRLEDLHYSLYNNSGQVYSFSPFRDTDLGGSSASSAARSRLPFWVYPKKGYYLGWIDMNPIRALYQPISWESVSMNLDPGRSFEARYVLLVDVKAEDLLKKIYQILGVRAAKVKIDTADFHGELMEVVIQDMSSRVFFSSFFEKPQPLVVMLPQGLYSIRANFFPAVVENLLSVDLEKENACLLQDPPKGKVKVSIRNRAGAFVPGKTTFIGLDPTRTPYFRPENPLETNNSHEYFKNSCFPLAEGLEVDLPVGTYMISASRGPEYTLDQKVIEVSEKSKQELVFHINKVIDTKNLISVDAHLHTLNSDGSMTIAERIKSVVAEGVDVAISADHNYLSDYPSVLKKLSLAEYIAVLIGQEVRAVPHVEIAGGRGLGEVDLSQISLNSKLIPVTDFKLPTTFVPGLTGVVLNRLLSRWINCAPEIIKESCQACGICIKHCPGEAMQMKADYPQVDRDKCINCYCCQEMCPEGAIRLSGRTINILRSIYIPK